MKTSQRVESEAFGLSGQREYNCGIAAGKCMQVPDPTAFGPLEERVGHAEPRERAPRRRRPLSGRSVSDSAIRRWPSTAAKNAGQLDY